MLDYGERKRGTKGTGNGVVEILRKIECMRKRERLGARVCVCERERERGLVV